MKQYINVWNNKNYIYHKYIENGKRKIEKVKFKPVIGIETNSFSEYADLYNKKYVNLIELDDIQEFNKYINQNKDYLNLYFDIHPKYQFIFFNYDFDIKFSLEHVKIFNIDIEVYSPNEFPDVEYANQPISVIGVQDINKNIFYIFAHKDNYTPKSDNVKFFKFDDEISMLREFISFINTEYPDVITGWNIDFFDIPYLINRIKKLLGDNAVNMISRYSKLRTEHRIIKDREHSLYSFSDIYFIDYLELYKKFGNTSLDSYSLDNVCLYELGEGKLNYKNEYSNLTELYEKDFEKYIDYNIKDIELVYLLNKKMKLFDIIFSIMYKTKSILTDVFGTIRPWDNYISYHAYKNKMLVYMNRHKEKEQYEGGYVKDVNPQFVDIALIYDITSSYPNQIIGHNISPECILEHHELDDKPELKYLKQKYNTIESFLNYNEVFNEVEPILKKYNVTMTANGEFFRKDKIGIITKLIENVFNERISIKKDIKKLNNIISIIEKYSYKVKTDYILQILNDLNSFNENDLQNNLIDKENLEVKDLLYNKLSFFDLEQLTLKILINSLYGAYANQYFRFFDVRLAKAITYMGQVCVRNVAKYLDDNLKYCKNFYSDTDSIFIALTNYDKLKDYSEKELLEILQKLDKDVIQKKIDEYFDFHTTKLNKLKRTIKMENEAIVHKGFFLAKKKYVLRLIYNDGKVLLDNPKYKVRGVEIIQSSTPSFCREKLFDFVKMLINKPDSNIIREKIFEIKNEFIKQPIKNISFSRSVNGLDKYNLNSKSLPIHVRASLHFNNLIKKYNLNSNLIHNNDKIKYIYIKTPNEINSNIIGYLDNYFDKFKEIFEIDYETQFEKSFLSPLSSFLEILNYKENDNDISNFFS